MHVNTQLKLLVGAADLIASGAALAANAALISAYPPPGLYRGDTQATRRSIQAIRRPSCSNMCRKAPAAVSGSRGGRVGEAPVTTNYAGQAPATVCMKPLPATGTMPAAPNCTASTPVVKPGSVQYAADCGGVKLNIAIRKIDAKTWEFNTHSIFTGAPMTGQQDLAGMRKVLAIQAKTGATAQERSDAAALLAQMGAYEAEMKKNAADLKAAHAEMAAEQGGAAAPGRPAMEQTVLQRYTRIADTCTAPR